MRPVMNYMREEDEEPEELEQIARLLVVCSVSRQATDTGTRMMQDGS